MEKQVNQQVLDTLIVKVMVLELATASVASQNQG